MPKSSSSRRKSSRTPKPKAARKSVEIAILSDIHSNLQALEAVLAECQVRGINRFFCLGDIVGYGANPLECLKRIRSLRCPTVIGNHDYYVATGELDANLNPVAFAGIRHSMKSLKAAERRWLRARPIVVVKPTFTLVHASLCEPLEWEYVSDRPQARRSLLEQTTPLCFCGHTHVPRLFLWEQAPPPEQVGESKFRFSRESRALLNPGSVGQPRNEDPRAQFAIFNPEEFTVELVAIDYDIAGAAQAILDAGLPEYLAERLSYGV